MLSTLKAFAPFAAILAVDGTVNGLDAMCIHIGQAMTVIALVSLPFAAVGLARAHDKHRAG